MRNKALPNDKSLFMFSSMEANIGSKHEQQWKKVIWNLLYFPPISNQQDVDWCSPYKDNHYKVRTLVASEAYLAFPKHQLSTIPLNIQREKWDNKALLYTLSTFLNLWIGETLIFYLNSVFGSSGLFLSVNWIKLHTQCSITFSSYF